MGLTRRILANDFRVARLLIYARILFWVVAAEVLGLSYLEVRAVAKRIEARADRMGAETSAILKETKEAVRSYRGIAVDIRKGYTHNADLQNKMTSAALGTMYNANIAMTSSLDRMTSRMDVTLGHIDSLVTNTDQRLNGEFLPASTDLVRTLDGRVAVLFDRDVAGLLQTSARNVDQAGADIHELLCNPEIPLIMREIRVNLENGEVITFYAGEIAGDAAELSEHYKNKLVHPSGWDYAKQILNLALYGFGEIIVPWQVTQKVQIVK